MREILISAARRLRARLTTWSGRDAPVRVGVPTERTVEELLAEAPESALWARFDEPEEASPTFIVVEGGLLSALINRLFGGADDGSPRAIGTEPTEVERAVGARVCRELVDALRLCWLGGRAPELRLAEVAPSARVAEDLAADLLYLETELVLGGPEEPVGSLRVLVPSLALRGGAAARPLVPAPPPSARSVHFDRVLPIEVDVVVELARLRVPIRRLRSLSVGDEIALPALTDAIARVEGRAALAGDAGARDGARSLRVTRRISPSTLDADDR